MYAKMKVQVNCKLGSLCLKLSTTLNESYDIAEMRRNCVVEYQDADVESSNNFDVYYKVC